MLLAPVSKKVTVLLILSLLVASFIINFIFVKFILSNKCVQKFLNKFNENNLDGLVKILEAGLGF